MHISGRVVEVVGDGQPKAGYTFLGLFRVTSYESKKHQLQVQTCLEGIRDISPTLGPISYPYLPSSTLHGPYCLSDDSTWLAKFALEKQTSQLSHIIIFQVEICSYSSFLLIHSSLSNQLGNYLLRRLGLLKQLMLCLYLLLFKTYTVLYGCYFCGIQNFTDFMRFSYTKNYKFLYTVFNNQTIPQKHKLVISILHPKNTILLKLLMTLFFSFFYIANCFK